MTYMLDTNIIIYAIKKRPEFVLQEFLKHDPADLCISSITLAELEYGVNNSSKPEQNRLALLTFLSVIDILPFDENAAREYGQIRYQLKTQGTPIGSNDLLIAAHAKAEGLTLVTNNTKEFERVPNLNLENWAA
ncbi:MAG: type II toxin-antitoxin system VapC family toxin [Ruminococcaceae bacterium]|nr:type II toxin-antitoxin system VapC family toxin [Oscillospiraceae bacterium]